MSNPLDKAVADLETVSLVDLNAAAALQTRKDRKYIVPIATLPSILRSDGLRVLSIDDKQTFRYESVYFDTPSLVTYRAAAQRRRHRFKVRTRSYLDSGMCWLEVKTRNRRGLNNKARLQYDIVHRAKLTPAGIAFVSSFDRIVPVSGRLRPVITTRYNRTTLLDQETDSRVTIDTNVEWETPDGARTGLDGLAIVETKTDGPPCVIDHRLWRAHYRPTKVSKFGTGLAALSPGLPANKWNRVLRRYFDWAPVRSDASVTWLDQAGHTSVRKQHRSSNVIPLLRPPTPKEHYG